MVVIVYKLLLDKLAQKSKAFVQKNLPVVKQAIAFNDYTKKQHEQQSEKKANEEILKYWNSGLGIVIVSMKYRGRFYEAHDKLP